MPRKKKEQEMAEVVEAEILDEGLMAPQPVYAPAVIDAKAYLAYTAAQVGKLMEPYADMDAEAVSRMDAKEVKLCHADLNRIYKEIEDQRKKIKAAYDAPLKAFEEQVRGIEQPILDAKALLHDAMESADARAREMLMEGLRRTYEDFAPALVPVVPFERVLAINPKWLNKSYGAAKAAQELEDAVEGIARDWEVLRRAAPMMRFYDEAEAVFFRTLDVSAAMKHNDMREAEQARIDQMKAEANIGEPTAAEQAVAEERIGYVIRIDLTAAEKKALMEYIKGNGIGANRRIGVARD